MTHLDRRRAAFAGSLLLPCVLLAAGCSLQPNDHTMPGQPGVGSSGYPVTVHFDQVENLVPNSTVQLDNVVVGTVASIAAKNWQADVTLRIEKSVRLPTTARFSIGQKTLLGAQYVQIDVPGERTGSPSGSGAGAGADLQPTAAERPTGAFLHAGSVVEVDHTDTYPSTESVLGGAALLLNNGGLSQISVITGELSTALRHRVPDTRSVIDRTNELLAVLHRDQDTIVHTLASLDRLSGHLADKRSTVARAIDRITPGLRTLNQERAKLVRAVTTTGTLSTRAAGVVQVNQRALLDNLGALEPILEHLGTVAGSLPEALKIGLTIPFPAMTTSNALHGDYANLFVNLDLSLPSLAHSFLGMSLPAALQAADPITAPLHTPTGRKAGTRTKATSPAPSATAGATGSDHGSATPQSRPTGSATGDAGGTSNGSGGGGCLLGLIGDC